MRRVTRTLLLAAAVVGAVAVAAVVWAYWTQSGTGAGAASVGALSAPGKPTATVAGSTVTLNWTAGSVSGGGTVKYHVERRSDPGSIWTDVCGSTHAAPITGLSCAEATGPGQWVYRITARYNSWSTTGPESDPVTGRAVHAPTSVTLANGLGQGNAYINATNMSSVSIDVGLDSGSLATDTVTLTVYDAGSAHTLTPPTAAGTSGAGTVHFTGLNLSSFTDGTITMSATATDVFANPSTATSNTVTKDSVASTVATVGVSAAVTFGTNPIFVNNETLNLTDLALDAGGSGVRSVAYSYCAGSTGTCTSGTPWTSIGLSATAANYPVAWNTPLPADGPYRIVAVATDNAGNTSASSTPVAVTVDQTAPSVPAPIVNGFS
ncbi:MAG: fibronectin type III domain-containing protein [Acidimicrobiia bacterium]